jgi:DNA-binding transcriptional ArsR family regulator
MLYKGSSPQVTEHQDATNAAFAALSDPTRRALLMRLTEGEATVTELARPFAISQPAISRHLKVLEDAGLIETRIDRTARPRRLRPETMQRLWDWLTTYRDALGANFTRLDALLSGLPDPDSREPEDKP